MTAVVPSLMEKSVTRRCTSMTGYLAEYDPALFFVVLSFVSLAPAVTQSVWLDIVGTMETFMTPFVPTRGVTSSCMPQLKNASLEEWNGYLIALVESELLFEVRLAATVTLGYLVVMSTVAFLPLATIMRGLENMRESFSRSRALRTRYISEKFSVPLKCEIVPSSPPMYVLEPSAVVPPVNL